MHSSIKIDVTWSNFHVKDANGMILMISFEKKIEQSAADLLWATNEDKGGYTVHFVPVPVFTILLINNKD